MDSFVLVIIYQCLKVISVKLPSVIYKLLNSWLVCSVLYNLLMEMHRYDEAL